MRNRGLGRRMVYGILAAAMLGGAAVASADETKPAWNCPYGGPTMMGGYGMGPGMMQGYGMPHGMMGGYGMGPGMMQGYGGYGGPGMMQGYGSGPGMMGAYGMGPGMMGYAGGVDLSADQRTKINAIRDETRKQHWTMMGEIMDQQVRLQDLYDAPKTDSAAIEQVYKRIGELQRQMYESSIDAHKRMDAVLTDEQRERLRNTWRRGRMPMN